MPHTARTGGRLLDYGQRGDEMNADDSTDKNMGRDQIREIPGWLDTLIYSVFAASNKPDWRKAQQNLDNDSEANIRYLGTYFPRTYAEVTSVMEMIEKHTGYFSRCRPYGEFRILSVGCGTGADIAALIAYLSQKLTCLDFRITLADGNQNALELCSGLLRQMKYTRAASLEIESVRCIEITRAEDLATAADGFSEFDLVITSKFLNELMGKVERPYSLFISAFAPFLAEEGLMILLDTINQVKDADGRLRYIPSEMNCQINRTVNPAENLMTLLPTTCNRSAECNCVGCYSRYRATYRSSAGSETSEYTCRVICRKKFWKKIAPSEPVPWETNWVKHDVCQADPSIGR